MDRFALRKRKKRPKSGNEAPNAANPHKSLNTSG